MTNAIRKSQSTVELQPSQAETLQAENEELRRALEEAQETIRSIQQDGMVELAARRSVEARLESELADSKLLQEVSAEIIQSEDSQALYDKIMSAAVSIMRSDFASMQMLYPERGELRLLACRGYDLAAAKFWEWVRTDSGCTCGVAMRTGQRAIAAEVQTCEFMAGSPDQANALRMGMLAMQSTPLIARSGKLVGMISTHWKQPHLPSDRDLRLLDILARQAADLVERKQAEESLRASEERYRTLFESMDEGYCVIEFFDGPHGPLSDYVHVEANPAYVTNAGIPDIVGKKVRNMVPDEADGWVEIYRKVLLTGNPIRFERELVATERYLELSAFRIEPVERRQVAVLFKDITARKKAESALSAALTRLQKVLEVETVGVMFWDLATGRMTGANDTFLKMMGYRREEVVAGELTWQRLTPPEYVEASLEELKKFHEHGRIGPYEKEYLRSDGTRQWLFFAGSSLGDNTCVEFCVDIADRKQAENQLREADSKKDEFLATLAHELRNPLAPIQNALQVMAWAPPDGEAAAESRAIIERQVKQMVRLIDDLLEISRISQGKINLQLQRTTLSGAIQSAVESCRSLMEAMSHRLVIEVMPETIYLEADPARLTQVFLNLLTNAAKYSEPGANITVSVRFDNACASVSVKDNGIGISKEMLPKVFDLFTQVDRSLEKSQGGLGIGLSLVKRLVELHGGDVSVESDGIPGRGSEFTVRLPAELVRRKETISDHALEMQRTSHRILIADDNKDAANSLAMLLNLMGNATNVVYDGLAAVESFCDFEPNVVFLDIGMPRLNGYEAAKRIRTLSNGKEVTLVAVSGWGQADDLEKSRQAGFDRHLVKPADLSALMKILSALPSS